MIEVNNLSKRYAGVTAVDGISFSVGRGEIVGFLGPNGAGKSTTMRMLTGFLPPTEGQASIAGFDIFKDSLKAREHIGYMPENVPLYADMRVEEYLRYRAALKGVPGRRMKERLMDVMDLCVLTTVHRKLIGQLSKGYRQRVGLADALIHEPELLILDEPTIGMDPNQIRQVRDLIKNLGRHHTILLSTHILSEVEATCSRVIIINKGRIEAVDSPQNLRTKMRTGARIQVELKVPSLDVALEQLRKVEGVTEVDGASEGDWARFTMRSQVGVDPREAVFALVVRNQWSLRELAGGRATLEEIFAEITHADEI